MGWLTIVVSAGLVAAAVSMVMVDRRIVRARFRWAIREKIDGLQYRIDHLDQSDLRSLESYENDLSAMVGDGDASWEEYHAHRARIKAVETQIREMGVKQDALRELLDEVPQ